MPSMTDPMTGVRPSLAPDQVRGEILRRSSRLRNRRRIRLTVPPALLLAVALAASALGGGAAQSLRTVPADTSDTTDTTDAHTATPVHDPPATADPSPHDGRNDDPAAKTWTPTVPVLPPPPDFSSPPAPAGFHYPRDPIVFTNSAESPPENWIMDGDGSNRRRLNTHPNVVVSPDGTKIAYSAFADDDMARTHQRDVVVSNLDGSDARKVAQSADVVSTIDWSPDGDGLAFVTGGELYAGGVSPSELWVVNLDGSGLRRLGFGHSARWSPFGDELVYSAMAQTAIDVIDIATGAVRRVVAVGALPAWSPDGSTILFRDGGTIKAVDAGGGTPRTLYTGEGIHSLSWSPDGRAIVFGRTDSSEIGTDSSWIWMMKTDGTGAHAITTSGKESYPRFPSLSPAKP